MQHQALKNEIVTCLKESIAALHECKENDFVLAYPQHHLAIRFVDGKPVTTTLDRATTIGTLNMPEEAWAYTPSVQNGNGEKAQVVSRQKAIAAQLVHLQEMLAGAQRMLAA